MARNFNPQHPDRIYRGCDRCCPTQVLACGNGSGRVAHPAETQGEKWCAEWSIEPCRPSAHGAVVGESTARDRPRVMRRHDRRGPPA